MRLHRLINVTQRFDTLSRLDFGRTELHLLQVAAVFAVPNKSVGVIVMAQRKKRRPYEEKARERHKQNQRSRRVQRLIYPLKKSQRNFSLLQQSNGSRKSFANVFANHKFGVGICAGRRLVYQNQMPPAKIINQPRRRINN